MQINIVDANYPKQLIEQAVTQIAALSQDCHKVKLDEIIELVKHSVWDLGHNKAGSKYCSRKILQLPCDLLIDYTNRRATIILKNLGHYYEKHSELQKECNAIELAITPKGLNIAETICVIRNEECPLFSESELEYTKKYGSVRSAVSYSNTKGKKRSCFTVPDFSYRLSQAHSPQNTNLVPFIDLCKKVGSTLKRMHDDNVIHGSLTTDTIFCSKNNEWSLGYFAASFTVKKDFPKGINPLCYSAVEHSAPESLNRNSLPTTCAGISKAAKASDMYALGCTLHEFVFATEIPWAAAMNSFMTKQKKQKKYIKQAQLDLYSTCKTSAMDSTASSVQKAIFALFEGLFHPSNHERIKIDQFLSQVNALEQFVENSIDIGYNDTPPQKLLLRPPPLTPVDSESIFNNIEVTSQPVKTQSYCELFGLEDDCSICN